MELVLRSLHVQRYPENSPQEDLGSVSCSAAVRHNTSKQRPVLSATMQREVIVTVVRTTNTFATHQLPERRSFTDVTQRPDQASMKGMQAHQTHRAATALILQDCCGQRCRDAAHLNCPLAVWSMTQ